MKGGSLGQRPRVSSDGRSPKLHPPLTGALPAEAELLDEGAIALDVFALQVVQEPPAAADELQQAAARVVIVLVRPQMLGELVDPLRQHRDLDLRRPGIRLVLAELLTVLQLLFR